MQHGSSQDFVGLPACAGKELWRVGWIEREPQVLAMRSGECACHGPQCTLLCGARRGDDGEVDPQPAALCSHVRRRTQEVPDGCLGEVHGEPLTTEDGGIL